MATLKHINSKNADYGAAEQYLLFEHDEFTDVYKRQLHDFGLEVAQGCVGTAVLATGLCIGWPVHIGQERHFLYPQRIDNDMHMNVAAVVMPVRVGADTVSYTHLDVYKRQAWALRL